MPRVKVPSIRRQCGFSLAEILLGLVIIIVAAVVALTVVNLASSSPEAKEARDQITQVLGSVRKVYPGPTYTGVTATSLVNRGVAPATMVNGANLVNIYGGTVTLAAASVASGTDNGVTIIYPQVPRAECHAVIAQTHTLFGRVVVGTTTVKDQFAATAVPFDDDDLEAACKNERNTLSFTTVG